LLPVIVYLASYLQDARLITRITVAFILARLILKPLLSFFYPTLRPYQAFDFQPLTSMFLSIETKASNSFPSSHIISIAAASGAMLLSKPIFAILFSVVAVFTGLGRVVLGFHYPKDIIFSLISGLVIGIIVSLLI
jgi:undecaprenyl-diphosphatase